MATEPPRAASPRPSLLAPFALLLALVGLFATDFAAIDRGVVGSAVGRDLVRITELATLRGSAGSASAAATMPVMVTQDGGPGWLTEAAEEAVDADPIFERGEPHLLQVEALQYGRVFGVRCQLWRQGWSLRAPQPLWATPAVWVPWMAALVGAGLALMRGRLAGAVVVMGLVAQGLMLSLPWPADFVRPSFSQTLAEGPLGHFVVELSRTMPDSSVAIGAGVVTLCALLMLFDHRRSPGEGGGLVVGGTLAVVGGLAWLEAALRAGVDVWLATPAGVVGALGLGVLWFVAWRGRGDTSSGETP